MKYGSVCSGVEAATLAWKPLGWECVFVSEVEPFPCAVLQHCFGATRPIHPLDPAVAVDDADAAERRSWMKQNEKLREDVQPTLTSRGPGAVCGKEQDLKSVRMRGGCEGGGKGALVGNNLSHTLATGNDQVIIGSECLDMRQVEAQDNNIAPTLIATDYKGGKCIVEHSVEHEATEV